MTLAGIFPFSLYKGYESSPSSEIQNEIIREDLTKLDQLVSKNNVNIKLPNNELPLHFAILENKLEVVKLFLSKEADIETKDFRNLNALEHAVLMGNEQVFLAILGRKIGNDLKDLQIDIRSQKAASYVSRLKSEVQSITKAPVNSLNPINRAAFNNHLNINKLPDLINDEIGLSPIHYAILGNQFDLVEDWLQKKPKAIEHLDQKGNNLLHFAVFANAQSIMELLADKDKTLINKGNDQNNSPLHYAAIAGNLSAIETLVKKKADPYLENNVGLSPITLIGAAALQKDPLSLSKAQIILFITSSLFWLSTTAITEGWVSDGAQFASQLLVLSTIALSVCSEFAIALNSLNQPWEKVITCIGKGFQLVGAPLLILFCSIFTRNNGLTTALSLDVGIQAWITYGIAKSTLKGLKQCWHYISYRPFAAMRNIIVYSVNTAYPLSNLATITNKLALAQCFKVAPSSLQGLSDVERLMKSNLNPHCPEHALMMMSPDFTMEQFRRNGIFLYENTYKNIINHLNQINPFPKGALERLEEARGALEIWRYKQLNGLL